jgi:23S rRNA pseudouridine2605 synthase
MADDNQESSAGPEPSEEAAASENAQKAEATDRETEMRSDEEPPMPPSAPAAGSEAGERISKVVSRAGIASRRDVERMIAEGRVRLNGETITTPVVLVRPQDRIEVDGAPLPAKERTRLFLYHKPAGLVTTEKDPEGRPTVFSALPASLPRLVSIGRLDFNTEGLLLLTNDGGLARVLAHPKTGWLRRYRVRAFGEITQDQLDRLKDGIEIDGMHYGPVEAHVDREQGANMWLTLGLREGKNREVKRILEHFGLVVNRLIRISFGPFRLGSLAEGEVEEVRSRLLKDQLGRELAREAKVDFGDEPGEAQGRERAPRGKPFERRGEPRREEAEHGRPGGDARVSRKAEAMAQARRSGSHRHSWRDPESWALRGERKSGSSKAARKERPSSRRTRGEPGAELPADQRPHLRGGRIADHKGRSILVERIVPEAAASTGSQRDERPPRPVPAHAPRGADDVLRRKSLREQGIVRRPRRDERDRDTGSARRDNARRERGGEDEKRTEAGARLREPRRFDDHGRANRPRRKWEGGTSPGDREKRPWLRDRQARRPADDRPRERTTFRPFGKRRPAGGEGDHGNRPHGGAATDRASREARSERGPQRERAYRPGSKRQSHDGKPRWSGRPRSDRPGGDRPGGPRPGRRPPRKPRD